MTTASAERRCLLVVGAGWDQTPIIQEAARQGMFVIAVDMNPSAPGFAFAHAHHAISTRDTDRILDLARRARVDGVAYMISESPVLAVHHVTASLGLPGPSKKSALATSDKVEMRRLFDDAGLPTVRYGHAATLDEAIAAARFVGFPSVMKSSDVGGQLGLARLEGLEDVRRAFGDAAGQSVSGNVIIEEWLDGEECNVVAVILDGELRRLIVSNRYRHSGDAFGVVERHLYPSTLDDARRAEAWDLVARSARALDVKDGILFPQIMATKDGLRIVETGERIPGGLMNELFQCTTGIDLVALQIDISLGRVAELDAYVRYQAYPAATVRFLNGPPGPLTVGAVREIRGVAEARAVDGVLDVGCYNGPNACREIRPVRNGRDRFFYVIAVGETRDEAVARSDLAAASLDFIGREGTSLFRRAPTDEE